MNKTFIIHKHDTYNTRRSKKSLRNKIKRKGKEYFSPFSIEKGKNREGSYINSSVTYSENIEEFCQVNRISRWRISNSLIQFEDSFCLFENPEKVLRTLLEMLFRAKTSQTLTRLRYKGKVSFGALYLIDNFCWEIGRTRKWQVLIENITEVEKEKLSRLKSFRSSEYETVNAHMINERVRINRSGEPKADQSYRVKSKEITDMVQQSIRDSICTPTYELPFNAYQAINSTIGEHFDNIILHAPFADMGILCGFYDKEKHEVTILIYNFGKTIYETLTVDSLPREMKDEIFEIVENHVNKNFFGGKSKFSAENALTLLALQEGISSRVIYDNTRGHGITDYIEHCFNLSEDCKIVIISGNTAIKIDKKYRLGPTMLFGRERRVIAMNSMNDIFEKPDEDYVINLNVTFPGVLIETTIPLSFES